MDEINEPFNFDFICRRLDNIIETCSKGLKNLRPSLLKLKEKDDSYNYLYERDEIAEQFRKELMWNCSVCNKTDETEVVESKAIDVEILGDPCAKPDSTVAKDLRYYIEDLAEDDNREINLDELVGPCGKTSCNIVKNIKDFIFHRGVFAYNASTDPKQCSCTEQMQKALIRKGSCDTICSHDCEDLDSIFCGGQCCVHKPENPKIIQEAKPSIESIKTEKIKTENTTDSSKKETQNFKSTYYFTVINDKTSNLGQSSPSTPTTSQSESKFKYCAKTCPKSDAAGKCTRSACEIPESFRKTLSELKCTDSKCPNKETDTQAAYTPSPADSDVEIDLSELRNPCNVKSCEVADRLIELIAKSRAAKNKCTHDGNDPCFCDCSGCSTKK